MSLQKFQHRLRLNSSIKIFIIFLFFHSSVFCPSTQSDKKKDDLDVSQKKGGENPKVGDQKILITSPALPKFSAAQATVWNQATFDGSCKYGDHWKTSLPYTALAHDTYGLAVYCGACIKVSHNGPTPVGSKGTKPTYGIITNECANCPPRALDMEPQFYHTMMGGDAVPGITSINWEIVDCTEAQPDARDFKTVKLIPKDGDSQYFFKFQVAGTTLPIKKVETKSKESVWKNSVKTNYNYYSVDPPSDFIDVRITCENGKVLEYSNFQAVFNKNVEINDNCSKPKA
ncbi:hypothetical protein BY996DRAFT_4047571 [Phakopsora pachyrhizi]|uniref:Expressed protein n=1 Tax=Phakopsora pachyrhizi TaxID=170000 RepID=A0AAV0AUZ8_PHAPC|nr:hypothetical protein BY996DRAFT_4047571 [Phakopsora pachyrhizi]CAH7672769.1 expressed protein [Phakopsora pachyrhizi]